MKLSQLLLTTSLCAVVSMPAFAKSLSFSAIDTNSDRVLSKDELVAAYGVDDALLLLSKNDGNGDKSISADEVRLSQDDDDNDDDDDDDDDDSDDDDDDDNDDDDDHDDDDNDDDDNDDDDSDDDDDNDGDDDDGDDD